MREAGGDLLSCDSGMSAVGSPFQGVTIELLMRIGPMLRDV
jgi:hypothetical protein